MVRQSITFPLVTLVTACVALTGSISDRAAKEIGGAIRSGFDVLATNISLSRDLGYAAKAFWRKNDRWPTDYVELSTFVEQTDGLLVLGQYDRVDFSELSEGRLGVAFVPQGQTNQWKFILSSKDTERFIVSPKDVRIK
jgi:hypothetical protein